MGRGYYQGPDGDYYQTDGDGKDVEPAPDSTPESEDSQKKLIRPVFFKDSPQKRRVFFY